MRNTTRRVVGVGAATACALATIGIGQALAASDPAAPPVFTKTAIASLIGASFVVSGDVNSDVRPELVASSFGPYSFGPAPDGPGTVTLYNNAARVPTPGHAIDSWTGSEIVSKSAGIYGPNQPTLSDVDGDGDIDVIVPGGNFFQSFLKSAGFGTGSGTLTWWEQRANGATWIRHDIIANSTFTGPPTTQQTRTLPDGTVIVTVPSTTTRNYSFHGVQHADLDGDGIRDLVTVGEDGGNPSGADDVVATLFLRGLGGGEFDAPVKLADLGGSLPVVSDVNGDGKLDIVSAQFFGGVAGQPFVPSFGRGASVSSFIWLQQGDDGVASLSAADFAPRKISAAEGPSFQIIPVPNFRGDGVTRWIGTNHTNKNPIPPLTSMPFSGYPEPAVYELTPGADPTQPWAAVKLTGANAFPVCGGAGQAAPGGVGAGDLDGDGDLDLAVSGDGSRYVYWVEQKSDGTFATNRMPDTADPDATTCKGGYGQAGGNIVADLNRDGRNEAVWGSFDAGQVSIWQR